MFSGGAQWPGRGARTQKDGVDPDGRECFSECDGLLRGNEMYLSSDVWEGAGYHFSWSSVHLCHLVS